MSLGPLIPGALKGLLDNSGVPYKQNGKSYILNCPRCKKVGKLFFLKSTGRFVCWYCKEIDGFQGNPEFGLSDLLGRPVEDLRTILYGAEQSGGPLLLDFQLKDFYDEGSVEVSTEILQNVEPDPDFYSLDSPQGASGLKYLESRGIPLEIAQFYGVLYHPPKSRVVFPVSSQGRLLGWQERLILADKWVDEETGLAVSVPKALTSPGLRKDRVFMFGDRLIDSTHAVLCEGPVDGIKAHLCGGNVVSMGKAVSQYQIRLLRNSGIRDVYLALDPDAAFEAARLVRALDDSMRVYDMRPPAHTDLGAMDFQDVLELKKAAPRVDRNYLFLYLKEQA